MPLDPGTRLGPYEILAPIGAGGMGEVYRAKDSRLDREVAIKVLPPHIVADAIARARFEKEAKVLANLSHPNIVPIYDIGAEFTTVFAVMELLSGETLRDRLEGGPLPWREAARTGSAVAEGLSAAHAKGIVHRDLKPENIFLTKDGAIKILDFGLAATRSPIGSQDVTTEVKPGDSTQPGTLLGTVGYMAPEQARGEPADARSDLFAFGAILHEMLSGKRAFRGDSPVETLRAIIKEEPDSLHDSMAGRVPPACGRIVARCLEKNPERRFQSARDLAFALDSLSGLTAVTPLPEAPRSAPRFGWLRAPLLGWSAGALLGAAAFWSLTRTAPAEPPSIRPFTYSGQDISPAVSPDRKLVVFISMRDGKSRVWLKQMKGGNESALTDGPDFSPRFSPDGTEVIFSRQEAGGSSLYRVPILGGEPRKVLDDAEIGDWSPDGKWLAFLRRKPVAGAARAVVGVVSAQGGEPRELAAEDDIIVPSLGWTPDSRQVIFSPARGNTLTPREYTLVEAAGGKLTRIQLPTLGGQISSAVWQDGGKSLVYFQRDSVFGGVTGGRILRYDLRSGRTETLMHSLYLGTSLDLLGPGQLVFDVVASRESLRQFSPGGAPGAAPRWLTRGGSVDRQPAISPDGKWLLFSSNRSANLDLWRLSLQTGALSLVTDDPAEDWDPAFAPDGRRILWSSKRTGHFEIWSADPDGANPRQLTHDAGDNENPALSPDGKWLVYNRVQDTINGIWKSRADGSEARELAGGGAALPEISPDGRQLSYVLNGTGLKGLTIRVVSLEDGSPVPFTIPVETSSATPAAVAGRHRWLPGGRALAFIAPDEAGRSGLFTQDFTPGKDTSSTRRKLAGFDPDLVTESFAISPLDSHPILAMGEQSRNLMIAEGVPGITPPGKK
jgi:serine/threonine protein kinase